MDEQPMQEVPPVAAAGAPGWEAVPPQSYPPPAGYPPGNGYAAGSYPPPGYAAPAPAAGLSDTAAGAIAYITIIPAIVFLVMEPYNRRPFVKFNSIQCLLMAGVGFVAGVIAVIPILGWLVYAVTLIALAIAWILCIINASQGKVFKLPFIGDIAAKNAGL